jgi:hypothetical protein
MRASRPLGTSPISLPQSTPPFLAVLVDTEEEFDWSRPFSRDNTSTTHMREIRRCQRIFERFSVIPTYLVDYPIASQPEARAPLLEIVHARKATVGAHLHPWVTPPYVEEVCPRNSYAGNLPRDVELGKLRTLRDQIAEWADEAPLVYRAGRYGVGQNSYTILRELGFVVDSSPSPGFDFRKDGGPDFRSHTNFPYWVNTPGEILCVPLAGAMVSPFPSAMTIQIDQLVRRSQGFVPAEGILSRLRLFSRIRLTPEGHSLKEMMQLTKFLLARGVRLFVLSFHSPTLSPGNTPYAKTMDERDQFLARLDAYLAFFTSELKGKPTTLTEFRNSLVQ